MSVEVTAPIPGKVIRVNSKVGDRVNEDTSVVTLESMKMEVPLSAPAAGEIAEIRVAPGDFVQADQVVVVLK